MPSTARQHYVDTLNHQRSISQRPIYGTRGHPEVPVFDRGQDADTFLEERDPNQAGAFHRTASDSRRPRSNVTAQVLGDPIPARF